MISLHNNEDIVKYIVTGHDSEGSIFNTSYIKEGMILRRNQSESNKKISMSYDILNHEGRINYGVEEIYVFNAMDHNIYDQLVKRLAIDEESEVAHYEGKGHNHIRKNYYSDKSRIYFSKLKGDN